MKLMNGIALGVGLRRPARLLFEGVFEQGDRLRRGGLRPLGAFDFAVEQNFRDTGRRRCAPPAREKARRADDHEHDEEAKDGQAWVPDAE